MSIAIKQLRNLAGLTQYELARLSGVERTRLSLAENGHIRLEPSEYERVKKALIGAIRRRITRLGQSLPDERLQ